MTIDKTVIERYLPKTYTAYYAHTAEVDNIKAELLTEHSSLVLDYAEKIAMSNGLMPIINSLACDAIPENVEYIDRIKDILFEWFWRAIALHDIGKINHQYQRNVMHNDAEIPKILHDFGSQHSTISMYLYLASVYSTIESAETDEQWVFLSNVALYFSYAIAKHHSTDIYTGQDEKLWSDKRLEKLEPFLQLCNIEMTEDQLKAFHDILQNKTSSQHLGQTCECLFDWYLPPSDCFPLYALIRLCYSLLTTADYLATAHYKNGWSEMPLDYGLIDDKLRKKIVINARTLKEYNHAAYNNLCDERVCNPRLYSTCSNTNLNMLRCSMSVEVIKHIRCNLDKRLFYIEAPTGGGKTNLSMLAMAELLDTHADINKVFYVFPFTSLITQTYQALQSTLGLDETDLAELHSKAGIASRNHENGETSEYLNYLDQLFMNYPISLLSHVTFFDIVKTNHKERNYLLQRLANSIVIIDEMQSYPPNVWDKIMYFIDEYAKHLNMRFVVMSATLPKIGDLKINRDIADKFVNLIEDKNLYFQNPNFCNRVEFDYTLLEWDGTNKENCDEYLTRLCEYVCIKSEEYADSNNIYPDSVYTIVEFIFKKKASEFYNIISGTTHPFDDIFLLSGTILEPQRKAIIDKLKSEEQRSRRTLLVTTQVVEAGVDIDMDLGFKDRSLIDSDEQLAGRINRNVNKPACKLFLFDCSDAKILYGKDDRFNFILQNDTMYKDILVSKEFDKLYQKVIDGLNRKNSSNMIVNISDLHDAISSLDFKRVNDSLKIIDQDNYSVFVPLFVPQNLLSQKDIEMCDYLNISHYDGIDGVDVWNRYVELIQDQDEDFVHNKIKMKYLRCLMSLFVFSIFPRGKDAETLLTYGREEYGFLYLENNKDIYSLEGGINTMDFNNSNFL